MGWKPKTAIRLYGAGDLYVGNSIERRDRGTTEYIYHACVPGNEALYPTESAVRYENELKLLTDTMEANYKEVSSRQNATDTQIIQIQESINKINENFVLDTELKTM